MNGGRWGERVQAELRRVREAGQWRSVRAFDARGQVGLLEGQPVVSFAGNDYLGLSEHPAVVDAAVTATRRWGTGATASRLVVGTRPVHRELEEALAAWKGCQRAMVFPSGYQANLGVITALAAAAAGESRSEGRVPVTILSDALNHASIVDGCRLARGDVAVYRHNDLGDLADRLAGVAGPALVVTDSVFSMDGDVVDVEALAAVCADHGDAFLVLDEAHAVWGPSFDPAAMPCPVVRIGTLSKILGAQGGFVAGSDEVIDLLVNGARSLIFTTGLAPAAAAAALAALEVATSDEGSERVAHLQMLVERICPGHPSAVVPVLIGDPVRAVKVAETLLDEGLLVPAIRPPTVPAGTCRLRVAVSASHTVAQVDDLLRSLSAQGLEW